MWVCVWGVCGCVSGGGVCLGVGVFGGCVCLGVSVDPMVHTATFNPWAAD